MSAASAAPTGDPIQTLHYCMRQVSSLGASDLHLKAGSAPYLRMNGELSPIPGMYAIGSEDMDSIVREITRHVPNRLHEFEQTGEADVSYELRSCARFRINIFRQRGLISIALRVISDEVPKLSGLNLPASIEQLATSTRGLVLVTGATGTGKSTTLAGMIDHINEHSARHIVTVEDPIEIVHNDKRSMINQREIGTDTASFSGALRRALRQDPDVILIGEMRDEETVRAALSAAETGHLVFSTLHTIDVMETIFRVLDFFPAALQRQARSMLAGTLRGVISQRLVATADGRSRVPAAEIMIATSRISDAILNPDDTASIHDAIQDGAYYGMQTFDQALLQLVIDRAVSVEEAMAHATSRQNFALMLESNSVRISRDTRKQASGSQTPGAGVQLAAPGRAVPQAVPLVAAAAVDPSAGAGVGAYLPSMTSGAVGIPAIPGIAGALGFPESGMPGGPQQPRPQPGIEPQMPGLGAA